MKRTPARASSSRKSTGTAGRPKQVAPAAATGGKGYRFENRVQAAKLLALCIGGSSAGIPGDARVVELRFQARVHGRFTDDLVCTLESSTGQRSRALMQMKSGLTARASDDDFTQAVGNAWLDYQSSDFGRDDILLIVYDMGTKRQMQGAEAVAMTARSSLTSADWLQKLLTAGSGNQAKRDAQGLIKAAVEQYANRECSPDELHAFLAHLHFLAQDLDADTTAECKACLHQIHTAAPGNSVRHSPTLVWSLLIKACMDLNAQAGAVDLENLKEFIGSDLAAWFKFHRTLFTAASTGVMTELTSDAALSLAALAGSTVDITGVERGAVASGLQGLLPAARDSSTNKLVSSQLDHINTKIKSYQYTSALQDLEQFGKDQSFFDQHQKARWHLLRGVCYWQLHGEEEAAVEFARAADLCEDDEKLVAARARAHLLRNEIAQAVACAQAGVDRFANSSTAWLVLANAQMIQGQSLSEADIPPAHRGLADPLQLVAWSLKAQGKLEEACATMMKALAAPDAGFFVADASLSLTIERAAGGGLSAAFQLFDEASREHLSKAVAAFEPRVEKLWAVQTPRLLADVAARLGMAYLLLNRVEDALAVYREAETRSLVSGSLLQLGVEALSATGRAPDALRLGRAALDKMPAEGLVAFAQLACSEGEVADTERALAAACARTLDVRAIDALRAMRWDSMLTRAELRDQVLDEVRRQLSATLAGSAVAILAITGRVLILCGKPGEADPVIARTLGLVEGDAEHGQIYLAAMLLLQAGRFASAAELLARILAEGQATPLHRIRLHALLRSGQLARARRLVRSFPQGWALNDETRQCAMELGQRTSDWDLLASLVGPQLERAPGAAVSWNFKFFVLVHQDEAGLRASIGEAPESATGSMDEIARLANVEMAYGDRDKAMRRLYRMRRMRLDDPEAAASHLASHLTQGDSLPLLGHVPDAVGPGTSVRLRDSDGNTLMRTIDPIECGELPLTEEFRNAGSADVGALMGLRVGEKLVVPELLTSDERTYEVVQIQNAFRRLLDLSHVATSNALVPSSKLTMMSLRKGPQGEYDFSPLTKQLQEQAEHTRQVFEIYRSSPVTIGGVAKLLNRDSLDVARGWAQQDVPMFVGGGTAEGREEAARVLSVADAKFVVDAVTLTELATIDCLDALGCLAHVFVTTKTKDHIMAKLAEVRELGPSGHAFQRDGQLGMTKVTDEDRAQEIRFYESIAVAIKRRCTVIPAYGPEDVSKVPGELRKVLSAEEFSVVLLSLQEDALLVSVDGRLRSLAGLFGVRGVWPQALLGHALNAKALSPRDYSLACVKMFFANRTFISLSATDLAVMAYQGGEWLKHGIHKFAKLTADGEVEFESAFGVITGFVGLLFNMRTCQFGVVLQLLDVLAGALSRHRQCGPGLEQRLFDALVGTFGSVEQSRPGLLRAAVRSALRPLRKTDVDRSLQVSVLYVTWPPFLRMRNGGDDAASRQMAEPAQPGDDPTAAGEGEAQTSVAAGAEVGEV